MGNCCRTKLHKEPFRTIHPSTSFHFDESGHPYNPNARYASNYLCTTKYSLWSFLPLNLWEQFHRVANVYFVAIVILNFMPGIDAFAKEVAPIPVVFTLAVVAIKDAYEDFQRHRSDRRVNRKLCKVFCQSEDMYIDELWENLQPGDFVRLHTNEIIPADVLLLNSSNVAGICHIETANLDGESNLKQREVVERRFCRHESFSPLRFTHPIEVESPSPELYKFNGKILHPDQMVPIRKNNMLLRGCVLRNTDFIEGIVVYAGPDTKAALNNTGPRFKRSRLEHLINKDIIWCVIILALICFTGAVGCGIWQKNLPTTDVLFVALDRNATTSTPAFQGFLNFWRFIIIFQSIIPLPLYVTIEMIKINQVWHMNQDLHLYDRRLDRRIQVRAFNILEDLGQVEYVFSDKTGTLTENQMLFKRASINGVDYALHSDGIHANHTNNATGGHSCLSSLDTVLPHAEVNFASLSNVVNEMSLISPHPSHSDQLLNPFSSKQYQAVGDEIPVNPTDPPLSADAMNQDSWCIIQDFILIMAICNTAVVSATKNSASPFQEPIKRKGLRNVFRSTLSKQSSGKKKQPSLTISPVKPARSLNSLFSRKRRPSVTTEVTSTAQQVLSSTVEEPGDDQRLATSSSEQGLKEKASQSLSDQGTPTSSVRYVDTVPQIVRQVSDTSRRVNFLAGDVNVSIQSLPPTVVENLDLDLLTPNAIIVDRDSSRSKKTRWFFDRFRRRTNENSSMTSAEDADSETMYNDQFVEDEFSDQTHVEDEKPSGTRTVTVVAHDGASYDLPVSDDFVLDRSTSQRCPLSDDVLLNSYESESPDEVCLVQAACQRGCKLLQRGLDFVLLWLPTDGLVGMRVLHILPFDSVRKCMSIIVRHPATNKAILYTKGADSTILGRICCASSEDYLRLEATRAHVDVFSRAGLRTLILAKRVIPEDELESWSHEYNLAQSSSVDASNQLQVLMDRIERDFSLIGATGIEDKLQPGVCETIESFREAGIHVWVLTGDKQETAVNIAHSAHLLTDAHNIIYINAASKLRTGYLINCHLHSLLFGHPIPTCEDIGDVASDDPDVESISSGSLSPNNPMVFTPQLVPANVAEASTNSEHVRLSHLAADDSPSRHERSAIRSKRGRLTRSVSETRYQTMRRLRRRPRPAKRNININPPKSASMLRASKVGLVIDGDTLRYALEDDLKSSFLRLARLCSSALCCRATPSQKAAVVSLVKKGLGVQTLAVGDGANDVNMIQEADVGVGISGQEGMQAVLASDFAISRFRFLHRLVIVHGHLCYDKLAHTALYMFYKDAVYIFLLFWFQLFNGFSGSNAVDQLSMILFSVTTTSIPPVIMGIWNDPIDSDTLMANPVLYRTGIESRSYRPWLFWLNILDAIWQTLIIFFVPYLLYDDSTMSMWRFGVIQMNALVLCSLLHAALETRTWVSIHLIGLLGSYFLLWLTFIMIYHAVAVNALQPEAPYRVIFVVMRDASFWLLTLVTLVAALLPRLLFILLRNTFNPTWDTMATLLTRIYGRGKRLPLEHYMTGSTIDSIISPTHSVSRPSSTIPEPVIQPPSSSLTSIPSVEFENVEISSRLMSRIHQLFTVSGRLLRGVGGGTEQLHPSLSSNELHIMSTSNVVSSTVGMTATDPRAHRHYTETLHRFTSRHTSVVPSFNSPTNDFDDPIGYDAQPALWPAADPNSRARSATICAIPNRSPRSQIDASTYRTQAFTLPDRRSFGQHRPIDHI